MAKSRRLGHGMPFALCQSRPYKRVSAMPPELTATLRSAEKLLRIGKIAGAIAEYTKAVRQSPGDWDTAILLASLHVRAGDANAAVEQYRGIATSLTGEGMHGRAANVLEKVLALRPGDEDALEQLAGA